MRETTLHEAWDAILHQQEIRDAQENGSMSKVQADMAVDSDDERDWSICIG